MTKIRSVLSYVFEKIAPFTHFIPTKFRRNAVAFIFKVLSFLSLSHKRIKEIPAKPAKPYIARKYPYGINLFGYFKTETGISQGTKLYAEAIETGKIPHTFISVDFVINFSQDDTSYNNKLSEKPEYAVNLFHLNPPEWKAAWINFPEECFDYRYNIGAWAWELETLPKSWLPIIDFVDELWVFSEFIANAVRKETDKPVTVIPYGISVPTDKTLSRKDFKLPDDKFLILAMFDSCSTISRKNPAGAIRAFGKAFDIHDKNVHLVIKINHPSEEDIKFINNTLGDDSRYTLISDRMEKTRLNSMISLCDVFISLHRSEGFGLVMAESMALGKPVVATNWSANTDFMNSEVACMVDYKLISENGEYLFYENQPRRWADPDIDQAADYLKKLYHDKAYYKKIAESGKKHIETYFSPEASAEKMKERLAQIL